MRNRVFINVLVAPTASGEIDLLYSTVGTAKDVSLTIQCTGILPTDTEITTAQKIYNCIYATLFNTTMFTDVSQSAGQGIGGDNLNVNINQDGHLDIPVQGLEPGRGIFNIPVYGSQSPSSQARPAWTDHVTSLFSQAQFQLTLLSNNTGANIYLSSTPIYLTIAEARKYGPFRRQYWTSPQGVAFTDADIISSLENAGNEWLGITNNFVVQSCFVAERDGYLTDGIQLKKYPLIVVDTPRVRRPSILQTLVADTTTIDILSKYIVNRDTGWLTFRFAQNLVFNYEPFDFYNEIKVSYVGGYDSIPREVKMSILDISFYSGLNRYESELKSGTTSVKFIQPWTIYKGLFSLHRSYFRSEQE